MARATGVADDSLRPALARLALSTNSTSKAQELLALALDISTQTGKPLEGVANALGKAYDGNTAALGKLGVGLSSAELKAMSFTQVQTKLSDLFGGAAAKNAETFQGRMDRLKIAFDEGKETVGAFILDAITPMVTVFVDKVIPTLAKMAENIGTNLKDPLNAVKGILTDFVIPAFKALYSYLADYVVPFWANIFGPAIKGISTAFNIVSKAISDNETDLQPLFSLFKSVATFVRDTMGPAIGTVLRVAFEVVGTAIGAVITAVSKLVGFFDDVIDKVKAFINLVKN
jgi:hypothetical protein